jgi:hypothetical protein
MRTDNDDSGSHWIVYKNLSIRVGLRWSRRPLRPLVGYSHLLLVTPQHWWSCVARDFIYIGLRMPRNQAGTGMEASFPLFSSSVRQAADPSVTGLTGKAKCASWCSSGMSVIREHVLSGQFVALPTGRNPHLLLPSWSKFFGWGGHGP